jgi:hypothetical protein
LIPYSDEYIQTVRHLESESAHVCRLWGITG